MHLIVIQFVADYNSLLWRKQRPIRIIGAVFYIKFIDVSNEDNFSLISTQIRYAYIRAAQISIDAESLW
jgi:hypothetical protein